MCSYREKLVGELFSMLKIRNLDSKEFFHPTSDFGTHLYGEREIYLPENITVWAQNILCNL